jgi:c-di-GMP-binding flagellar brake protein YcgR
MGAHFVLYKPVSSERAKSSFRAARALMKSERRRNARVAVEIPVIMRSSEAGANMKVTTLDLSEGGMAVVLPRLRRASGRWQIVFTLPGKQTPMEIAADLAWEGAREQAGLRFLEPAPEVMVQLREWLKKNSPDGEQEDPPIRCQLTDLSLGGCYLEISSPFPVSSRLTLSMRAAAVELRVQGVVRVMHPDRGMGVEFTQNTLDHRRALEKFLIVLTENRSLLPELFVEPEGLEVGALKQDTALANIDDPLLKLFYGEPLSVEAFQQELQKQREMPKTPAIPQAAAAHA